MAKEDIRRRWAIKFTVTTWRWKCVAHMWDKWRLVVELGRTVVRNLTDRWAQRRLFRRFAAWRQWQLRRHVRRFRNFVELIKPDVEVSELPAEDSDDEVELDKFGRPKPPLTRLEKLAAFRRQDTCVHACRF